MYVALALLELLLLQSNLKTESKKDSQSETRVSCFNESFPMTAFVSQLNNLYFLMLKLSTLCIMKRTEFYVNQRRPKSVSFL